MNLENELAERIKEKRKEMSFTLDQMAKEFSFSRRTYCDIEGGKRVKRDNQEQVAAYLGCKIAYYLIKKES